MEEIKKIMNEIWENENISEKSKVMLTYIIAYKIADTTRKILREIIDEELSK